MEHTHNSPSPLKAFEEDGYVAQTLKELEIGENTLFIFTSDNGPVNRTKGYPQRRVRGDTMIYGHDSIRADNC
ncbi:MAG: hypothetical protein HUJ26_02150 [Planctomycetaceae bacterium]|nr:hypothetical protein [Planctomycetaceae bacterium]